jgi:hypothetical protein
MRIGVQIREKLNEAHNVMERTEVGSGGGYIVSIAFKVKS